MKTVCGYWYTFLFFSLPVFGYSGLLDSYTYQGGWEEAPAYIKIGLPVFHISMFGFFGIMLADFFSKKDAKHPILVGFSLFLFNWFAILIYFWIVVYRRDNSNQDSKVNTVHPIPDYGGENQHK